MLLRPSQAADIPAITALYARHVLHGTGTFELEPPDEADMARRHADVTGKGLPWLVAQDASGVIGYAYANGGLVAPGNGTLTGMANRVWTLLPDEVAHGYW